MLKILAISDIEDNQAAIELLLNDINPLDYDCAVISGDIGPKVINWVIKEISLLLPLYYIYGNKEYSLEYATEYASNAYHVHDSIYEINGYYISGYSGCPANWGKNPIYLAQLESLDNEHAYAKKSISDLEAKHKLEKIEFNNRYDLYEMARLNKMYSGRTKIGREARAIESEWYSILEAQREASNKLAATVHHKAYKEARKQVFKDTLHENKQSLFNMLVVEKKIDLRKTILLTHEKFTYLNDYFPVPALINIYGHTRPHCHKLWRKTHFVDVSALDNSPSFFNFMTGIPKPDEPGIYAEITIDGKEVSVNFCELSQCLTNL